MFLCQKLEPASIPSSRQIDAIPFAELTYWSRYNQPYRDVIQTQVFVSCHGMCVYMYVCMYLLYEQRIKMSCMSLVLMSQFVPACVCICVMHACLCRARVVVLFGVLYITGPHVSQERVERTRTTYFPSPAPYHPSKCASCRCPAACSEFGGQTET